jgi:uncharacterized membrane protein
MKRLKEILSHIHIKQQLYLFSLCCAVIYAFVLSGLPNAREIFHSFFANAACIGLCYAVILCAWVAVACSLKNDAPVSLTYGGIVLSPLFLLIFWKWTGTFLPLAVALGGVIAAAASFYYIFSRKDVPFSFTTRQEIFILGIIIAISFLFFSFMSIRQYANFSFFNAKDFAIYNQIFYNSMHGRFFENSAYGSHFAEHNSPFLFLLLPLYYFLPHPLTLLLTKIMMLSLSVIPFYLIARAKVGRAAAFGLTLAYLFYPYLVSQNFTPPHEITYAPFFILFTFYFYLRGSFIPYLIFLLLSLSIKEHVALLSIALGLLAAWEKKSRRWVITPIILGLAWSILSLFILSYFRSLYPSHPQGAWLLENIKMRLGKPAAHPLAQVQSFLLGSNAAHWYVLRYASLLITPLGIIAPFFSNVIFLCLPELALNFLSDRPGIFMLPYHYNILVSCFLLIAAADGIKTISSGRWVETLRLRYDTAALVCSLLIAALVIVHAYSWVWLIGKEKNKAYIQAMHEAIRILPPDAFVTTSRNFAIHVSARSQYNLIEDKQFGDYILIDESCREYRPQIPGDYRKMFGSNGILLLKKD